MQRIRAPEKFSPETKFSEGEIKMEKKELIYEGKAKKVYAMSDPDYCMVEYKDDATAFNGLKKGTITGKGVVNNRMSNFMFKLLEEKGIKTHFVEEVSDRETDFGELLPDSEQVRERVHSRIHERHDEIQAHYKEHRRGKAPESDRGKTPESEGEQ